MKTAGASDEKMRVSEIYVPLSGDTEAGYYGEPEKAGDCPVCGGAVIYDFDYCPFCGQALDWKEDQEEES